MGLFRFLTEHNIPFEENVSLSKKTWIKTGGNCAFWIMPVSLTQLSELCLYLYFNNISFDIVGQTSNIFFHSTYNPHIVISTIRVNSYVIKNNTLICDCGVNVVKLAKECLISGFAGFYGLVGLPGTVASAVVNNASCFNCSLSSMLISADVLMPDGKIKTFFKDDFCFASRTSIFKRKEIQGVILSVKFLLHNCDNVDEEIKKAEATIKYRQLKQERPYKNLGSVFAHREYKLTLRNIIAMQGARLMVKLRLLKNFPKIHKNMLLSMYGYNDLKKYVSDKNLNTFIWRDEFSEDKFERYKKFMLIVFKNLEIEIEEKI